MLGSYRELDSKNEAALGEFLDEYFYSRLRREFGWRYERVTDADRQLRGIDVIVNTGEHTLNIDEKASMHYANAMLPTFAFEISSIQGGGRQVPGWFVNDALETNFYFLIWPNTKTSTGRRRGESHIGGGALQDDLSKSRFTILEGMLIPRQRLIDFVDSKGWSVERLSATAQRLRDDMENEERNNGSNRKYMIGEDAPFYFYYTDCLAEKPINLVMKREQLLSLSWKSYLIAEDGIARISSPGR